MKRILSVVLMFCLLMALGTTALADRVVYQDEEAPELLEVSDGQGNSVAALIRDAEGNVIATIPSEGLIKRVCIGDRAQELDQNVAQLLEKGLFSLMEDEHYSRGFWTVDTDLFYVEIPEEYAEYFANGSTKLEMSFNPAILDEGDTLIVLTTIDGDQWDEVQEVTYEGDGHVQVGIKESGLLTFLVEHEEAFSDGSAGGDDGVAEEADKVADENNPNFTPSVSGKLAPEVVTFEEGGESYAATILDSEGNASALVPAKQWLVVTPLSERKYNPDVVTYELLQWAYDTLCAAPNLGGLPAEGQDGTLGEVIDRMLAEAGTGLTRMDMTISDLFEISVYGDYLQLLKADENNMLEVTFDRGLEPDDTLIVLCTSGIDRWHVVDANNVVINEDGSVTLRLKHTGVFVFLVERPAPVIDPNAADTVTAP